jgi:pimeloyl-ACP methyl ester carboxylesterase
LLALGTAGFTAWKTRAVAHELVDPPFYHPQPLARVEATYADLAKGDGADPGGAWTAESAGELQLWRLHRAKPAPGVVLLLHGFGDDRWGTSPALRWFPELDAAIFTYLDRDDAIREGRTVPPVTFGVRESEEVLTIVHRLEAGGVPRNRILLMGRSLGASVGLLALDQLEAEGKGPLAGIVWEGPPISSRDFAERLVRGPQDRWWHVLAPPIGAMAARWAGHMGHYDPEQTNLLARLKNRTFQTPALVFLATQDRLSPPLMQSRLADHFRGVQVVASPTWHLHCSEVLGPDYAKDIRAFTERAFGGK